MSLIAFLSNKLLLQDVRNVDSNSEDRVRVHREILKRKPIMQKVFKEFYSECMRLSNKLFNTKSKKIVELGAGSSPVKDYYPQVLTSDLLPADHLDLVVNAQEMPFEENSVSAIWGVNCFHHFPSPEEFFKELIRVLEPGGGCVLIDPYYSPLATKFFKEFCEDEDFDKTQANWSDPNRLAMTGANQALTYIVFKRDKEKFLSTFPELEICYASPLYNYVSYVLSGGVNFVQLVPNFMGPVLKVLEFLLTPLSRLLALHHIVVIRKKS